MYKSNFLNKKKFYQLNQEKLLKYFFSKILYIYINE
jgi:hypothetical protein